jgi:hypothetical protein
LGIPRVRPSAGWYNTRFPTFTFPAAFDPATAPAPFHNYTCDGCHVRNGSGIPIKRATVTDPMNPMNTITVSVLDKALGPFMYTESTLPPTPPYDYNPYVTAKDYTFTGEIKPMKLVFFDLNRRNISSSIYSNPLAFKGLYYANALMNFYGDSFHVTQLDNNKNPLYNYTWTFGQIPPPPPSNQFKPYITVVDPTARTNNELNITYPLWQVNLGAFTTPFDGPSCPTGLFAPNPNIPAVPWPASCKDINGAAINTAINGGGGVGFMHLNGKRLGNLGATEAIPNAAITGFRNIQIAALGGDTTAAAMAGTIAWENGIRGGIDPNEVPPVNPRSPDVKLGCEPSSSTPLTTCWIGRFGWVGDRTTLEDQVANAAFVEMGLTSSQGFNLTKNLLGKGTFPIRYGFPNCGLANQACVTSAGNADLTETDIDRMADYARWLGSPTRSEFTVSLPSVIAGEQKFRDLQCHLCHVIDKIAITNPSDTMLPPAFRNRLAVVGLPAQGSLVPAQPASPFLSYLGTDLLMHDMGYLSQVALQPVLSIRDGNGVVLPAYQNYVQKIRTPALKGLRFNRFVTDSQRNTVNWIYPSGDPHNPACDFLLHDGRACDAIEAAFLHDGPEILKLGMITKLSKLGTQDLQNLRAFLYSL